jgi:non-ribosomal peptide synthetase component F
MAGMARAVSSNARVTTVPLLTPAERRQMLVEWNASTIAWPDAVVPALVHQHAARNPAALMTSSASFASAPYENVSAIT